MAVLRWILTLPVIIICVYLALSNRQGIEFTYSPFHEPVDIDLYFLILCSLGIGLLIGSIITWFSGGKIRTERRALKKENKELQKELETAAQNTVEQGNSDSMTLIESKTI